jgi:hypothetical protein
MRRSRYLSASVLLLAGACSKSAEGLFVSEHDHSAMRIYREGQAYFLELPNLRVPPGVQKPTIVPLERKPNDTLTAAGLLGAALSLTLTDSGLLATTGGTQETYTRVTQRSSAEPPTSAFVAELLRARLTAELAHAREEKGCRTYSVYSPRRSPNELDALESLLAKASIAATVTPNAEATAASRWLDEYTVTGTIALPALQQRAEHGQVCAGRDLFGGCAKYREAPVILRTAAGELAFRGRVAIARYHGLLDHLDPEGSLEACNVLTRKALAFREEPAAAELKEAVK